MLQRGRGQTHVYVKDTHLSACWASVDKYLPLNRQLQEVGGIWKDKANGEGCGVERHEETQLGLLRTRAGIYSRMSFHYWQTGQVRVQALTDTVSFLSLDCLGSEFNVCTEYI